MKRIDEEIRRLGEKRLKHTRAIAMYTSTNAPIRRLPQYILARIFSYRMDGAIYMDLDPAELHRRLRHLETNCIGYTFVMGFLSYRVDVISIDVVGMFLQLGRFANRWKHIRLDCRADCHLAFFTDNPPCTNIPPLEVSKLSSHYDMAVVGNKIEELRSLSRNAPRLHTFRWDNDDWYTQLVPCALELLWAP